MGDFISFVVSCNFGDWSQDASIHAWFSKLTLINYFSVMLVRPPWMVEILETQEQFPVQPASSRQLF